MSIIRDVLEHSSMKSALLLVSLSLVIWYLFRELDERIRLSRLPGARGYSLNTWVPFGINVIMKQADWGRSNRQLETFRSIFEKAPTSTCEAKLFGTRVVFTADPENIKAILATQFCDFGKGEPFHEEWKDFLGDSIFTTDGDMWHASRQLIRPQFVKERISNLECFESHLKILFKAIAHGQALDGEDQKIDVEAGNGKPFDISDLFYRYTLDVATDFLLGKDVKSLSTPRQDFAVAFNEVQRVQSLRSRMGPLRRVAFSTSFRKGLRVINELCDMYITRALHLSPEELASKTKSDQGYNFMYALASFTRDPKTIRDQVVAVLLAARDTTAATLSWSIYELSRHPECVAKLRREIMDQVGLERHPTYEDLKSMEYLQSVLNETLRLYPSVPFNLRQALRDCTLPRGGGSDGTLPLPVLKNTPIGYAPLVMQRRADLYPPATPPSSLENLFDKTQSTYFAPVESFSPERWFHWQPKPWQYIPFNGGPRICAGQQFALTEMAYVLARLFQRFERVDSFMHEIDGGRPSLEANIVLQPGDGVRVAFWRTINSG